MSRPEGDHAECSICVYWRARHCYMCVSRHTLSNRFTLLYSQSSCCRKEAALYDTQQGLRIALQSYSGSKGVAWYIMKTSSNGNISALLAICARNSSVTSEFPTQRPVTRSFDVFLDVRLNKRFSKQSWCLWFETPSRPLWRHCKASDAYSANILNSGDVELHSQSILLEQIQL